MTEKQFKEAKIFVWLLGICALFFWTSATYVTIISEPKEDKQIIEYLFLVSFGLTISFLFAYSRIRKYKKQLKQKREMKKNNFLR